MMQTIIIERQINPSLKDQKSKALNLIFEEFQLLENGKSNKEILIDFLDEAISAFIEIPIKDNELADVRENIKKLIWIRDLIKLC